MVKESLSNRLQGGLGALTVHSGRLVSLPRAGDGGGSQTRGENKWRALMQIATRLQRKYEHRQPICGYCNPLPDCRSCICTSLCHPRMGQAEERTSLSGCSSDILLALQHPIPVFVNIYWRLYPPRIRYPYPSDKPHPSGWMIRVRGNELLQRCSVRLDGRELPIATDSVTGALEARLNDGETLDLALPSDLDYDLDSFRHSSVVVFDGDKAICERTWGRITRLPTYGRA